MTKRHHYSALEVVNSSLTKKIAVNAAAMLFSQRINNMMGDYVVVLINDDSTMTDWEAFRTLEEAETEMERAAKYLQYRLTKQAA